VAGAADRSFGRDLGVWPVSVALRPRAWLSEIREPAHQAVRNPIFGQKPLFPQPFLTEDLGAATQPGC
jgi:hypothetical protein